MKIKQTILLVTLFLGFFSFFVTTPASAATCGGVETSIIDCDQTGICKDGTSPYEGIEPKTDKERAQYFADNDHYYGKCKDGSTPDTSTDQNGIWGILFLVINILTAGIGVVAVGGIVYGSILYASAGGSADQVKKARTIIINVVIGIVAYALMYALLNFIVPGGVFNQ